MANGIYKRPDSKYYWISYIGLDGRIVRESSRKIKYRDAQSLLTKRKNSIEEGVQPEVKRIKNFTFKELATEYLKWAERQKSFKSKSYLIKQLVEAFGNYPLRRFNSMQLEQYQTARLKKGNKPATVNRFMATMKHMFTKAVDWYMVEEEKLKQIGKVKFLPENNKRLRYLSKEECQTLISACSDSLRPIVITALNTGMRKGEILRLSWDRVDLKHGFILLEDSKNGERREIPINGTLRETLRGRTRRLDVPYVFYDPKTGKPFTDIKKGFKGALRRSKIQDFRFHDLRHCFGSHLVMSGVDITTVKELLGHKSLKMTLRYAHLAPAHKVKAVDLLDGAINGPSTSRLLHVNGISHEKEASPVELTSCF
jgi:integrase